MSKYEGYKKFEEVDGDSLSCREGWDLLEVLKVEEFQMQESYNQQTGQSSGNIVGGVAQKPKYLMGKKEDSVIEGLQDEVSRLSQSHGDMYSERNSMKSELEAADKNFIALKESHEYSMEQNKQLEESQLKMSKRVRLYETDISKIKNAIGTTSFDKIINETK